MTRFRSVVAVLSCAAALAAVAPAGAQRAPQSQGDPREAVTLDAAEVEALLAGMRTYLESIQGIVAALAENDVARVPAIAGKSGARALKDVSPVTGLKAPLAFTSMSLDTHDKFDKLADAARKGTSRTEVLGALRDIMANCISCHATYRLAP